jgi:hypothetical protein
MTMNEQVETGTEAVTIGQMKDLAAKIVELRKREAEVDRQKKELAQELDTTERQMLSNLEASGLTQFRAGEGLFSVSHRTSVKVPKEPEDRAAFFKHLQDEGLFNDMITVHSATLNSYYKSKLKEAQEKGLDDCQIPGIGEVTINQILSFRSAKSE